MKIGLVLPLVDDAGPAPWPVIRDLAVGAEAGGLDSIWVFDHLLLATGGGRRGIHEAWTILAAAAAVTSRIELGTLVLATGFRHPPVLAKMVATLEAVAGDRVFLGLGCGWHEEEFRAFGVPFRDRVSRFEEALDIVLPLLRGERVTYRGRHFEVDGAELLPPPTRPGERPFLIAARGPRMLRQVVERATAWNAAWYGLPDSRFDQRIADLHAACEAGGRDPATIEVTVGLLVESTGPEAHGPDRPLPLEPAAIADGLATWADLGVRHVQFDVRPATMGALETFLAGVERFRARR